MLQIKNVSKRYVTGELVQSALDGVSLNLRDSEFVAVLGPSGSGKTTLLNIIGGLDRYDSGDLVINGISTKKYRSHDWDSYRNHTIGFVFQSYNLIEHQSILSNVELALTISGVRRKERRARAKQALEKVGLSKHIHKKPNQLSGGQMQRVAIARALVNDPDVLLADEPTGALDSATSEQVMELLKEVAKDRLVVMVTHNPELADRYANRIVNIRDGKIVGDTNPYDMSEIDEKPAVHKNMGKSSMSPITAFSLSFKNLLTKKARTILTSFAGSIGIIGIALILALSTGVNNYIIDVQKSTMASYPIILEARTMDLSSFMNVGKKASSADELDHDLNGVYSNGLALELESALTTSFKENNLSDFKKYLDDKDSPIHEYIGENGIIYSYDPKFSVYSYDPDGVFINADGSNLYMSKTSQMMNAESDMYKSMGLSSSSPMAKMYNVSDNFDELLPSNDSKSLSNIVLDNYELAYGDWPENYNDVLIVINENHEIPVKVLYELGMLPSENYEELMKKMDAGEEIKVDTESFTYEDICNKEFMLIPECDLYEKNDSGNYTYLSDNESRVEEIANSGLRLNVCGIICPKPDAENLTIDSNVAYTRGLTDYLIEYTDKSEIVNAQRDSVDVNVLNGMKFSPENDNERIADAKIYIENLGISDKANLCMAMFGSKYKDDQMMLTQMMSMGESELAAMLDSYMQSPEDDVMLAVYDSYISTGDYDSNMSNFGVISLDAPSTISIYTDSFENKDRISSCIDDYNETASEEDKISYTDYVGLLLSSVTLIINIISYVLIAFVSVSLVVSSIMIGIITYISVLERTKEIGILRALGASKGNISLVFLSETLIEGLCAGLIGIGLTLLLLIPGNAVIHFFVGSTQVNAVLPFMAGIGLTLLSVILTMIGGLIPSKKAANMDPVTALRSE